VAASIDKGKQHQPENPQGEKRSALKSSAARSRSLRRQGRNRRQSPLRQEIIGKLSPPTLVSRLKPVPIRQLLPRPTKLPSAIPSRFYFGKRPQGKIVTQASVIRVAPRQEFPQNSQPKESRNQERYTREGEQSGASRRINPREVNQAQKRDRSLNSVSQRFNPLTGLGKGRQENKTSRTSQTGGTPPDSVSKTAVRRPQEGIKAQSAQDQRKRGSRRSPRGPSGPLVYMIRLLILGIGIGAIVGTMLSALNPSTQASVKANDRDKSQAQETPTSISRATPPPLTQEIPILKAKIQTLAEQNPKLQPGVFLLDLDTGAYLDWQGSSSFAAASTIKVPILIAFFQDVDAGKIRLDELLTLKPEMIADGSGELQYKTPGSQYSALEVATKMIEISDNTATNMLIGRLGGAQVLNQRFRSWGLTTTEIRNRLPDIAGTNTTTPKELSDVMSMGKQGELVSLKSRDRLLDIMQRTETNSMLPKGLGVGATIAHKTGTIGSLLADVGLVDMPNGKRYIISVMVKRPHSDGSAEELIRQISRTVYDYFSQSRTTPIPSGRTGSAT